jgi:thiosulfate/3-mercaptopyruvate sulfurtransferase
MSEPTRADLPWPLVETDWLGDEIGHDDMRIVDCSVVMKTLADGSYTFVGARDDWLAGHIPGSTFVDVLTELKDHANPLPNMLPPAEAFAATMSKLGIADGTRVVLYDRSNHAWAARVWWMLRVYGFDDASVLNGGWRKWAAEGRPSSQDPDSYPAAGFVARFRPGLMVDKTHVRESIADTGTRIVNALSPEEHRGEAPTRFPRVGRIAGSVNVYCQSLVDPATAAYLPRETLRARFESAGALDRPRTITYCGGGIAACSDALALTAIGARNVAVYDGSLAEWTADSTLPMETG